MCFKLNAMVKFIFTILCFFSSSFLADPINTEKKIKVCVIGAGPSGISTVRHLADNLDKFEIIVFEKASDIGGQWLYTDKTGKDEHGYPIYSSMYKNLRTNEPIELMNFPDWPVFEGVDRSCVPHWTVFEYLKNYTDHFQLRPFIKFNANVENVKLHKEGNLDKWIVKVTDVKTLEINEFLFDAVIVCNGHFFSPHIPVIPGLENFKGQVLHSHDYRKPDDFKNKSVVILGARSSGTDIGFDLANVASKVFLSHNNRPYQIDLNQVKGIDRFENGNFVLKDNSSINADVLLLCTGYNYAYPFLDDSSEITVDDNYVSPLYKHMVNVEHPSMSFVGIVEYTGCFSIEHVQAQYIVSLLKGMIKLPPKEVMLEDAKLTTANKRRAHKLPNANKYMADLAFSGGFTPIPKYYSVASKAWKKHFFSHMNDFKNYNLVFNNDKTAVNIVKIE